MNLLQRFIATGKVLLIQVCKSLNLTWIVQSRINKFPKVSVLPEIDNDAMSSIEESIGNKSKELLAHKKSMSFNIHTNAPTTHRKKIQLTKEKIGAMRYGHNSFRDKHDNLKLSPHHKKSIKIGVNLARKRIQFYNQPDDHSQQFLLQNLQSRRKSTYEKNVENLVNITAMQFSGITAARLKHLLTRKPQEEYTLKKNFKWDFH
ncbi:unnamed protein product [Moneuplotes crassus]|uniref:Uncharacterized protein n=1 Tax=Euplotes crassus TaxID=5936 RepID=A0AAD1UJG6_EUPCR|nr:unnamed protein product [Moneuplotes crassus]